MKRLLIAVLFLSSILYAKEGCPMLDIENKTKKDFEIADEIVIGLNGSPVIKNMYFDILKSYNNTKDIKKYITQNGLEELGISQIWGTLLASDYSNDYKTYNLVLKTIDSKNPNWCNLNNYKSLLTKDKL
jgi:hypothetical protein